jgi:hypothetical protein
MGTPFFICLLALLAIGCPVILAAQHRTTTMTVQVQLLTEDASTVVDTVEVPGNDAGWPIPGVIVYEGAYFIGPDFQPKAAMAAYIRAPGFVVPNTRRGAAEPSKGVCDVRAAERKRSDSK